MMTFSKDFEERCAKKFESDSKIGILCSISPEGYPHMSLISSISVKTKTSLMWGQFSQGLSKNHLAGNPKTGFLVVSPDQYWWTGKALHTGSAVKGEDFEYFNNKPLFRYNSYCGFGAVHYEDLIDVSAGEKIPLAKVLLGFCKSKRIKGLAKKTIAAESDSANQKIPPYGIKLASGIACLKFIAWVDSDGFPRIIPALQGVPAGANRLVFSLSPYGDMIRQIPAGAKAAVYLANLDLESLLLQGRWLGTDVYGGFRGGIFETGKVYNSMLPLNRYIYPPSPLPRVFGAD